MIDLILYFHRDALIDLGRPNFLCNFCIKNYIGTQSECLYSERPLNHPVVYTTDRSKAVVPMLFLFCVAL